MEADAILPAGSGKNIVIVAGEASGDLHGSMLVTEMLRLDPGARFFGIGGDRMKKAGVELTAHASDLAVVGVTEVIPKLAAILACRRALKDRIRRDRPDLLILIDFPDFNMPLAKFAHKQGIPVFYYISPQVWAWRKNRIYFLEKYVDAMAVILPFEEEFYRSTRLPVRFVGHPLLDRVFLREPREKAAQRLGLEPGRTTVALLPGSRRKEVSSLLPVMFDTARRIADLVPGVQFVLPLAEGIPANALDEAGREHAPDITVVRDSFYEALGAADGAIVASGTSTLEAALLEVPMVIIYKVSVLSYLLGRMFINVDYIGLVNIIAGRRVVPEYIQGNVKPAEIAGELASMLASGTRRSRVLSDLRELRSRLGEPGAAARAAAMAFELIHRDPAMRAGNNSSGHIPASTFSGGGAS